MPACRGGRKHFLYGLAKQPCDQSGNTSTFLKRAQDEELRRAVKVVNAKKITRTGRNKRNLPEIGAEA
ncbi:hypothetical protein BVH74_13855 [Halopseudomonas phragmitis]|uniref:Uncharacterized protein n=1 Tax=Halopseudomonas phragmitis TaxID=1931241 RepID=A0A1V0B778_9GAMM|nr:hypothetical protein BVH74_13855 [Halopseudomonas phragmitis]